MEVRGLKLRGWQCNWGSVNETGVYENESGGSGNETKGSSNETGGSGNETGGSSSEIGECAPHSEVAL